MLNIKVLGLLGALAFAAPVAAAAGPANGLAAHTYADLATLSPATAGASVTPGDAAKVEKVWWRRGWGCCHRFRFGYGFGWRHRYLGGRYYAWHRPFWHHRWIY